MAVNKKNMPECPECDKIIAHQDESRTLSDFVDWLNANGYAICELVETGGYPNKQWVSIKKSFEHLFAEYYVIDLNKCEQERRALLEARRG